MKTHRKRAIMIILREKERQMFGNSNTICIKKKKKNITSYV